MKQKQRYIGSVRFYKHLILTVVGLMILIPSILSVLLGIKSSALVSEKTALAAKLFELQKEKQEVQAEELQVLQKEKEEPQVSEAQTKKEDWNLLLVNEFHPLAADFEVELQSIAGGKKVDARIVEDLEKMMDAMRKEGMQPLVCSAYRTLEKQSGLFEEYMDERLRDGWEYKEAFYKAKMRVALPGTSEHHTGLAVDIVGKTHQSLDDAQANTPEAKWLAEHCGEYGFILRYPEGKTEITGIEYESWHFRYVGKEAATDIMAKKLTLEEYLDAVDK